MSEKRETTLQENKLYSGRVLTFYVNDVRCPNGNKATREMVTHPGGVCILPILNGKVIIEKQYRYPYDCDIIELPAGKLEKGENIVDAAMRELEEETGFKTEKLISLGTLYPSVGYTNEVIHLFAADCLIQSKQKLDEDEFIDITLMPLNEVLDLIQKDKIRDAKTIAAVLKYKMFIDKQK